jgi:hypothetical protein
MTIAYLASFIYLVVLNILNASSQTPNGHDFGEWRLQDMNLFLMKNYATM